MKTAYVILGMHRSGTSSVAGVLAHLGVAAPRTMLPLKDENPKGFWESTPVMELNEEILAACGSSWDDARSLDRAGLVGEAGDGFRRRARDLIDSEFGGARSIVLKDPRICRFYDLWRDALIDRGYRPTVIMPLRPPEEVAASIAHRNGLTRDQALDLWLRHVQDAELASRRDPRLFMLWHDLLADWRGQVKRLEDRLGPVVRSHPSSPPAEIDAFLSGELRRQQRSGRADAHPAQTLWDRLSALF